MNKLLHLSANIISDYSESNHTRKIWNELSKGFNEYHLLARNNVNKYQHIFIEENGIHLHLLPKIFNKSKVYFFSSIWLFYIIKKYDITYILSQCPILGGFNGVLASKLFKIPIMVEIHGDNYFKYYFTNKLLDKFFNRITSYVWKNSTIVRSLSLKMSNDLNDLGIKKNVKIIPNRVDLSTFSNPKKNFILGKPIRIVSVGRFVEQKGYDLAINAVNDLKNQSDLELHLVGGGKLFNKLNSIKGNNNDVYLINWATQNELRSLLTNADIYIQPSKPFFGEAMPRTILEAMAMKLPIIATKVGAIPGVLNDHENAILIEPNSVDELKKAILTLISNHQLRRQIAERAYQDVVEKYEWNNAFDLYRNELISMRYENT